MWGALVQPMMEAGAAASKEIAAQGQNWAEVFSKEDKARLELLKRRQAMGQLGLTDEEIARLREVGVAPVQAQMRELNLRNQLGVNIQDVGSGQAAATALASQDAQTRQLQDALAPVIQAQSLERSAQEDELLKRKKAQEQAFYKALFGSLTGSAAPGAMNEFGEAYGKINNITGQSKADAEAQAAIDRAGGQDFGEDNGLAVQVQNEYGGF